MKPEILIVEDDLIIYSAILLDLESKYSILDSCQSGEACLALLKRKVPDLILMDIKLSGELNGVQTAKEVRKKYRIPIVFLTEIHDRKTVEEAGKASASGYLIKPFQTAQLLVSVELALYQGEREYFGNSSGFFKIDTDHVKVNYADIKYIKAESAYCDIYLQDGRKITLSKPLNQMLKRIPYPDLIRVHKSYSLNKNFVTKITGKLIYIKDFRVKVGDTYQQVIKDHFDLI